MLPAAFQKTSKFILGFIQRNILNNLKRYSVLKFLEPIRSEQIQFDLSSKQISVIDVEGRTETLEELLRGTTNSYVLDHFTINSVCVAAIRWVMPWTIHVDGLSIVVTAYDQNFKRNSVKKSGKFPKKEKSQRRNKASDAAVTLPRSPSHVEASLLPQIDPTFDESGLDNAAAATVATNLIKQWLASGIEAVTKQSRIEFHNITVTVKLGGLEDSTALHIGDVSIVSDSGDPLQPFGIGTSLSFSVADVSVQQCSPVSAEPTAESNVLHTWLSSKPHASNSVDEPSYALSGAMHAVTDDSGTRRWTASFQADPLISNISIPLVQRLVEHAVRLYSSTTTNIPLNYEDTVEDEDIHYGQFPDSPDGYASCEEDEDVPEKRTSDLVLHRLPELSLESSSCVMKLVNLVPWTNVSPSDFQDAEDDSSLIGDENLDHSAVRIADPDIVELTTIIGTEALSDWGIDNCLDQEALQRAANTSKEMRRYLLAELLQNSKESEHRANVSAGTASCDNPLIRLLDWIAAERLSIVVEVNLSSVTFNITDVVGDSACSIQLRGDEFCMLWLNPNSTILQQGTICYASARHFGISTSRADTPHTSLLSIEPSSSVFKSAEPVGVTVADEIVDTNTLTDRLSGGRVALFVLPHFPPHRGRMLQRAASRLGTSWKSFSRFLTSATSKPHDARRECVSVALIPRNVNIARRRGKSDLSTDNIGIFARGNKKDYSQNPNDGSQAASALQDEIAVCVGNLTVNASASHFSLLQGLVEHIGQILALIDVDQQVTNHESTQTFAPSRSRNFSPRYGCQDVGEGTEAFRKKLEDELLSTPGLCKIRVCIWTSGVRLAYSVEDNMTTRFVLADFVDPTVLLETAVPRNCRDCADFLRCLTMGNSDPQLDATADSTTEQSFKTNIMLAVGCIFDGANQNRHNKQSEKHKKPRYPEMKVDPNRREKEIRVKIYPIISSFAYSQVQSNGAYTLEPFDFCYNCVFDGFEPRTSVSEPVRDALQWKPLSFTMGAKRVVPPIQSVLSPAVAEPPDATRPDHEDKKLMPADSNEWMWAWVDRRKPLSASYADSNEDEDDALMLSEFNTARALQELTNKGSSSSFLSDTSRNANNLRQYSRAVEFRVGADLVLITLSVEVLIATIDSFTQEIGLLNADHVPANSLISPPLHSSPPPYDNNVSISFDNSPPICNVNGFQAPSPRSVSSDPSPSSRIAGLPASDPTFWDSCGLSQLIQEMVADGALEIELKVRVSNLRCSIYRDCNNFFITFPACVSNSPHPSDFRVSLLTEAGPIRLRVGWPLAPENILTRRVWSAHLYSTAVYVSSIGSHRGSQVRDLVLSSFGQCFDAPGGKLNPCFSVRFVGGIGNTGRASLVSVVLDCWGLHVIPSAGSLHILLALIEFCRLAKVLQYNNFETSNDGLRCRPSETTDSNSPSSDESLDAPATGDRDSHCLPSCASDIAPDSPTEAKVAVAPSEPVLNQLIVYVSFVDCGLLLSKTALLTLAHACSLSSFRQPLRLHTYPGNESAVLVLFDFEPLKLYHRFHSDPQNSDVVGGFNSFVIKNARIFIADSLTDHISHIPRSIPDLVSETSPERAPSKFSLSPMSHRGINFHFYQYLTPKLAETDRGALIHRLGKNGFVLILTLNDATINFTPSAPLSSDAVRELSVSLAGLSVTLAADSFAAAAQIFHDLQVLWSSPEIGGSMEPGISSAVWLWNLAWAAFLGGGDQSSFPDFLTSIPTRFAQTVEDLQSRLSNIESQMCNGADDSPSFPPAHQNVFSREPDSPGKLVQSAPESPSLSRPVVSGDEPGCLWEVDPLSSQVLEELFAANPDDETLGHVICEKQQESARQIHMGEDQNIPVEYIVNLVCKDFIGTVNKGWHFLSINDKNRASLSPILEFSAVDVRMKHYSFRSNFQKPEGRICHSKSEFVLNNFVARDCLAHSKFENLCTSLHAASDNSHPVLRFVCKVCKVLHNKTADTLKAGESSLASFHFHASGSDVSLDATLKPPDLKGGNLTGEAFGIFCEDSRHPSIPTSTLLDENDMLDDEKDESNPIINVGTEIDLAVSCSPLLICVDQFTLDELERFSLDLKLAGSVIDHALPPENGYNLNHSPHGSLGVNVGSRKALQECCSGVGLGLLLSILRHYDDVGLLDSAYLNAHFQSASALTWLAHAREFLPVSNSRAKNFPSDEYRLSEWRKGVVPPGYRRKLTSHRHSVTSRGIRNPLTRTQPAQCCASSPFVRSCLISATLLRMEYASRPINTSGLKRMEFPEIINLLGSLCSMEGLFIPLSEIHVTGLMTLNELLTRIVAHWTRAFRKAELLKCLIRGNPVLRSVCNVAGSVREAVSDVAGVVELHAARRRRRRLLAKRHRSLTPRARNPDATTRILPTPKSHCQISSALLSALDDDAASVTSDSSADGLSFSSFDSADLLFADSNETRRQRSPSTDNDEDNHSEETLPDVHYQFLKTTRRITHEVLKRSHDWLAGLPEGWRLGLTNFDENFRASDIVAGWHPHELRLLTREVVKSSSSLVKSIFLESINVSDRLVRVWAQFLSAVDRRFTPGTCAGYPASVAEGRRRKRLQECENDEWGDVIIAISSDSEGTEDVSRGSSETVPKKEKRNKHERENKSDQSSKWSVVEVGASGYCQPQSSAEGFHHAVACLSRGFSSAARVSSLFEWKLRRMGPLNNRLFRGQEQAQALVPSDRLRRSVENYLVSYDVLECWSRLLPLLLLRPALGLVEGLSCILQGVRNDIDQTFQQERQNVLRTPFERSADYGPEEENKGDEFETG